MQLIKTIPGDSNFHLFEELPHLIYSADSIRLQQKENINRELLHQCYVIVDAGTVKARAALYNNPRLNYGNKRAACIGNYECVADNEIAQQLLKEIAKEAKALGFEYLIGPMNGSTWDDYRFSIDKNSPTFFTEPDHHLYYNDQFNAFGFEPVSKYISGISDCTNYKEADPATFKSLYANGLSVRLVNLDDFDNELRKLYDLCTLAFKNNFLYTPISFERFKEKYQSAKQVINPEFFIIAEDTNEDIVGFMFCIDDLYNRQEKNLIIKTIARHPDEKWKGMTNLTGDMVYTLARDKGYQHVLHAFMHESNASTSVSKNFAGSMLRNYVLYGMEL